MRVSLRAEAEGFSIEDNGLLKVPRRSELVVTSAKVHSKENQ